MMPRIVVAALLGLAASATAQAASQAGTQADAQTGAQDGASPSSSVAQANTEAARRIQAQQAGREAINAGLQAQYDDDMASYRAQVEARQIAIAHDEARYDHQQRAYADAMRAWRAQVDACKRGHSRACRAPTPNPADYW